MSTYKNPLFILSKVRYTLGIMNRKAYHTLEFYKIIERLASEAGSAGGRKRCMELEPMQDLAAITAAQQETEDALTRLYR